MIILEWGSPLRNDDPGKRLLLVFDGPAKGLASCDGPVKGLLLWHDGPGKRVASVL